MEVKILKAGSGDSILIHHKEHNILIDGGNDSKYLLIEIEKIYKLNQKIDLLIITHHDDDHIKGIIDLLEHIAQGNFGNANNFIHQVIFNSRRLVLDKMTQKDDRQLSYKQAYMVEELLIKLNKQWQQYTDESETLYFDDLKIEFLSPTEQDLQIYSQDEGAYLSSDFKCDWKSPMSALEKYIDDDSQDLSISNKSSVVMQFECEGKRILFTGDVTPHRLESILNKLIEKKGENPVLFDYIKLPHHGSYRSLNKNLIEKISCHNFIITTNSQKYFLPNKRAFLKILKFLKRDATPIKFIFNYEETIGNLEISEKEKSDYNFVLIPNNENYGSSIR